MIAGDSAAQARSRCTAPWVVLALTLALIQSGAALAAARDDDPLLAFDRIWESAGAHVYPRQRAASHFNARRHNELRQAAATVTDLDALARDVVNPFLDTLAVSHTRLYTRADPEYALFQSLFHTREIETPRAWHTGLQLVDSPAGPRVRAVLDGGPAAAAGLRRGDLIQSVNAGAPRLIGVVPDDRVIEVVVARGSQTLALSLTPRLESPHAALLTAMRESARVIERGNRRLGYVRLWSGTDPAFLELLRSLLEGKFATVDGLLLDLRDGMGGAWYDYLDPFFASRDDFFIATWIGADGKPNARAIPPRSAAPYFDRPLAVLINEGTRSGKEALAFQFQKSGRATLIGTRTEGAFTAGRGFFAEDDAGHLLYLAVGELLLDGHRIEGIGIDPDVVIDWPLMEATVEDPQLQRAMEVLEAAL